MKSMAAAVDLWFHGRSFQHGGFGSPGHRSNATGERVRCWSVSGSETLFIRV